MKSPRNGCRFFVLLAISVFCSSCATFDGLKRDLNAARASISQEGFQGMNMTERDKAIEKKCSDLYIPPGKADPIDRSAVVSCYSVEIFNAMSESSAFRQYVAMDCMVRNGKRSGKCGNAESVAIERSWHLLNKQDSRYFVQLKRRK